MKIHLPYYSEKTTTTVNDEIVVVKPFQIILWVSIATEETPEWDPRTPRIPAILDVGNSHNFALTHDHLIRCAGIHPDSLRKLRNVRESGRSGVLHRAGLWLHTDGEPIQLSVNRGIAVMPGDWPRLPILGLRALMNSKLQTFIYGDTKRVIIRTPPKWYWPF